MVGEVVEAALSEKIQRLERRVGELESDLSKTTAVTLEAMLGPLRLREAVLFYFGTDAVYNDLTQKLADKESY